jgi:hypothetical protein
MSHRGFPRRSVTIGLGTALGPYIAREGLAASNTGPPRMWFGRRDRMKRLSDGIRKLVREQT